MTPGGSKMAGEGAAGQPGPVSANQILSSVFSFYGNELGDTLDFSSDLFTGGAEMNDVRLEYLQERLTSYGSAPHYPPPTQSFQGQPQPHTFAPDVVRGPPQHLTAGAPGHNGAHLWYPGGQQILAPTSAPLPHTSVPLSQPFMTAAPQQPGPAVAQTGVSIDGRSPREPKRQVASAKHDKKAAAALAAHQRQIPQRFLPKKTASRRGSGGSSNAGSTTNNKTGQVSHSVAEKQRRDRINTLIDELRELVPIDFETAEIQPYGDDPSKRPKHVVLSDTIKFVRNTRARQLAEQKEKDRVMAVDAEAVGEDRGNCAAASVKKETEGLDSTSQCSNGELPSRKGLDTGAARATAARKRVGSMNSDSSQGSDTHTLDTNDSENTKIEISVGALQEDCKFSVNVNGKDRNGLLHDITRGLKSMGLEIKTAVIKTEATGVVSDTFEVDRSYCKLTPDEVKLQLTEVLHEAQAGPGLDKRKRTDVT